MGCSLHDQGAIWICWIPSHMLWTGYSSSSALVAVCLLSTSVVQIYGAVQKSFPNNLVCRGLATSEWPWTRMKYFGVRKECSGCTHQVFLSLLVLARLPMAPVLSMADSHALGKQLCLPHETSFVPTSDRLKTFFQAQPEHFDGALTLHFHAFTSCPLRPALSPRSQRHQWARTSAIPF